VVMSLPPEVQGFFDPKTFSVTYLVINPVMAAAAIIDPLLDYEPRAARITTTSANRLLVRVLERALRVEWLLEPLVMQAVNAQLRSWLKSRQLRS
jgi:hypothetical protein